MLNLLRVKTEQLIQAYLRNNLVLAIDKTAQYMKLTLNKAMSMEAIRPLFISVKLIEIRCSGLFHLALVSLLGIFSFSSQNLSLSIFQ